MGKRRNRSAMSIPAFRVNLTSFPQPGHLWQHPRFPDATLSQLKLALDWAREDTYNRFWEAAQATAEEMFGLGVQVISPERDGMVLAVTELGDYGIWDAADHEYWGQFQRNVLDKLAHLSRPERVIDLIWRNRWYEEVSTCHQREEATMRTRRRLSLACLHRFYGFTRWPYSGRLSRWSTG